MTDPVQPYEPSDEEARKKAHQKLLYRHFNKPFYQRVWFWLWLIIAGINTYLMYGAAQEAYRDPCFVDDGVWVCANSSFERIAMAIGGGIGGFIGACCLSIIPLLAWLFWTFGMKPKIRKEQIAEALAAEAKDKANKPTGDTKPDATA